MKTERKILGLLAMIPLLTVALSISYIGDADASQVEQSYIRSEDAKMGSYFVIFKINAGEEPLDEGKLLISSDRKSKEVLFSGVNAGQSSSVRTLVLADDPSSIQAKIVSDDVPKLDLSTDDDSKIDIHSIARESQYMYMVTFWIDSGDEELPRGQLLVESDKQSVKVPYDGVGSNSHSIATTFVIADDPSSITASFLDFDLKPSGAAIRMAAR